jgi:hypothetical protein
VEGDELADVARAMEEPVRLTGTAAAVSTPAHPTAAGHIELARLKPEWLVRGEPAGVHPHYVT